MNRPLVWHVNFAWSDVPVVLISEMNPDFKFRVHLKGIRRNNKHILLLIIFLALSAYQKFYNLKQVDYWKVKLSLFEIWSNSWDHFAAIDSLSM